MLARGALYHLLRNRHYLGQIVHKGVAHPGQHAAIVERALFDAVQAKLDANARARRERPLRPGGSPLTGLIFDDAGQPMSPAHARGKSGRPHRYYVSKAMVIGQREKAGSLARLPARAIEELIADRLARVLAPTPFAWERARAAIERIVIGADSVAIALGNAVDVAALLERLPHGDRFDAETRTIVTEIRLGQRSGALRLLDPHGRRIVDRPDPDPALLRALAKGWRWRELLLRGDYANSTALAQAEGVTQTSLHRFVRLAYLAPDLLRQILDGRQRPGLTLDQLCRAELPLAWAAQRRLFSARTASD